ncbi:MAG: alanyl-tRNA editing protein [Nitrososphaerota archaeon]|nr:alanyl-tRNA editing protein [Candidatus Calditenuis fumarioli]
MKHGKTELLYLDDSYLREFEAEVLEVQGDGVVLSATAFHPTGGGLVSDTGTMEHSRGVSKVVEAKFVEGGVLHVLEGELPEMGERVKGVLDWERRYRVMRMHTSLHALSAVVSRETGALVTGNQVKPDVSRVDFSLEALDRDLIRRLVDLTNSLLAEGRPVRVSWMPREEAMKLPGITKLADRLPPELPVWRIVEIEGIDLQADGGPHVRNTAEIGRIEIVGFESKGRRNKRVYFTLSD